MSHKFGFAAITLGVLLELVGFSVDAVLHLRDETLAAREGVFTLANPGHLLVTGGLMLASIGVCMCLATRLRTKHWTAVALLMALGMATLVGSGAVSLGSPAHNHTHAQPDADGALIHHSAHEINVTWEQLQEIDRTLGETKQATLKYLDPKVALADGYKQEGPSRRGAGAHFVNRKILDAGVFDPIHPTVLLYERKLNWDLTL